MAKIRTIKPSMTTDEKLAEVSIPARFLFTMALMFVDDAGRMEYSPKRLKMQVFPGDMDRDLDINPLVSELCSLRLFLVYEIEGRKHLCIPNFLKHQRIHKPTPSTLTGPDVSTWNKSFQPGSKNLPDEKPGEGGEFVKKCEELEVEVELNLRNGMEGITPGGEIALDNLDSQVNQIGHEYPGNEHMAGVFLPRDQQEAIAQAVVQDGYRCVLDGTIAIREAVVNWPAHEKKYVPNAAKFYRERQYLKDPAVWERGNGKQPSKAIERASNNRDAILTGLGVGQNASVGGPSDGQRDNTRRSEVVVGQLPRRESKDAGSRIPQPPKDG